MIGMLSIGSLSNWFGNCGLPIDPTILSEVKTSTWSCVAKRSALQFLLRLPSSGAINPPARGQRYDHG